MVHISIVIGLIIWAFGWGVYCGNPFSTRAEAAAGSIWPLATLYVGLSQLNRWIARKVGWYDLFCAYFQFVLLHRWNKIPVEGLHHIRAGIGTKGKLADRFFQKVIELNDKPVNKEEEE